MQKEIGRDSIVEVGGCYYLLDTSKPVGDGYFIWKGFISGDVEVHKFHSDSGYGIKTWTQYSEKDKSSVIVNHSGYCGMIAASNDLALSVDGIPLFSPDFIQSLRQADESGKGYKVMMETEMANVKYSTSGGRPKTTFDERPKLSNNQLIFTIVEEKQGISEAECDAIMSMPSLGLHEEIYLEKLMEEGKAHSVEDSEIEAKIKRFAAVGGPYPIREQNNEYIIRCFYEWYASTQPDLLKLLSEAQADGYRSGWAARERKGEKGTEQTARMKEALAKTMSFVADMAEMLDCDSDGHRYSTGCRKCDAVQLYIDIKDIVEGKKI